MSHKSETAETFKTAHSVLLIGYSIFIIMYFIISFLLGWEKLILIPVAAGLIVSWALHLLQVFTDRQRLWLTAGIMMCSYFFYGIHLTSTFDLAIVMAAILMLFIQPREKGVILLCQFTYYITMTVDLVRLAAGGEKFDILLICRITMHYMVITMISGFIRNTITKWDMVTEASDAEIAELTESAVRLNDFLANVSHELRTPVNAVIGLSGICLEKEENPEIKNDLSDIRKAGYRVADQISDILDFSEIDKGSLVKNCEDYLITSMINDLMLDFRAMKNSATELIVDVSPSIPAVMNTDVAKLKKIIKALVSNALKFCDNGGVRLKITSEKQEYGINLLIEVSDTGRGMSEDEIEHVYERFYQSDSGRSRNTGGLGLGLGIVSGFVSLLGGFMVINSTPGKGTKVTVSLPQQVVSDTPCMSISRDRELAACTYMDVNSFTNPYVREYYASFMQTLILELGFEHYRADSIDAIKKLANSSSLTHLFVGKTEYESNTAFFNEMAKKIYVTVFEDAGYVPPAGSKIRVIERPFYGISIVNALNSSHDEDESHGMRMLIKDAPVLVVDDEPMNLVVAKSILKKYEMKVATASSGPEAINKCRDKVYSLIFMDHMMSGMDGVEALKKIRTDVRGLNHETPAIALTANAMSSAKQMFMNEGFDGFVSKPIEIEELERVMKKVLPKDLVEYVKEYDEPVESTHADEPFEFSPADEPLEFTPADETPGPAHNDSTAIEFTPDDDAMEFNSAGDAMEFSSDDDALEFAPQGSSHLDIPADEIFARLKECGVNTDSGLGFCAGDNALYFKITFGFAVDMKDRVEKLCEYYDNQDWRNYEVLIHSTKSTAKMVGAEELSGNAKLLEEAAHTGDAQYLTANHSSVIEECRTLGEQILLAAGNDELVKELTDDGEGDL